MPSSELKPSKEKLMHLLAEAAELEHNLLCSYLFASFSLKESVDEDLSVTELSRIDEWRASLIGVCIEEMTHLAQVANLTISIGGRPHLNRPNIPVAAGYHPAAVRIELTRLDLDTLNHFVFLERPEGHPAEDGKTFETIPYERVQHHGSLMPSGPNYESIGAFYATLAQAFCDYARHHGEARLFSGPLNVQLRPEELHTDSLCVVETLEQALKAIESIVLEGEGSPAEADDSHFKMFIRMRDEFVDLAGNRPSFDASRDVARNPVMHAPISDERAFVTDPGASRILDAANAAYGLMLRTLSCCFETPWDRTDSRQYLLKGCMGSMKALSILGRQLTLAPLSNGSKTTAGVSFAMLRSTQGWIREEDGLAAIEERAFEIESSVDDLPISPKAMREVQLALNGYRRVLN